MSERVIDSLFQRERLQKTLAYLDAVIFSGKSRDEHAHIVAAFLAMAHKYSLTLMPDKHHFTHLEIVSSGHILEHRTERADPNCLRNALKTLYR